MTDQFGRGRGRPIRRAFSFVGLLVAAALLLPAPLLAEIFMGKNQAIERAFPDADRIERQTHVLTREEAKALEDASKSELPSRLITIYKGWKGDEIIGYMHIDVHPIRARSAALMIVLSPTGRVEEIMLLAFHEDTDYMLPSESLDALKGKTVGDAVEVGVDVDGFSGATLTVNSTTAAVRRALAYYSVLLKSEQADQDTEAAIKPAALP